MKYTQVAADAFQKLQLNAGILLTEFDPSDGSFSRSDIFAATSGGAKFTAIPEYVDYGEDIDNVPANTKELKKQTTVEVKLAGTAKTIDSTSGKMLVGAADWNASTGKLTPRADILAADFEDIWWVGDYSDDNSDETGGFVAIRLIDALNTGGFSMQSNDDGKADFEFEFTGHYSLSDITVVPYEIYIKGGTSESVDLSSMTKEQLLAYAAEHNISGVTDSMTKAEIIAAIEAAQ